MVYYDSADIYISSATTLREKITRIDAVIEALETTALRAAATGNLSEYALNDGQTTIKTVYRDVNAVAASITAFETIKERYINRLNGRHVRLVDGKNFRGR